MDKKSKKTSDKDKQQAAQANEAATACEGEVIDDTGSAAEQEVSQEELLAKMISEYAVMEKQRAEAVDVARRTQADFDNYRKRNRDLRTESLDEGFANAVKCILPTLDTFERALACEVTHDDFYNGMALVHKQLTEALVAQGLTEIATDGMFDPSVHEAVLQSECEGKESGAIIRVMQKGYMVHSRIVRHAMVEVAK